VPLQRAEALTEAIPLEFPHYRNFVENGNPCNNEKSGESLPAQNKLNVEYVESVGENEKPRKQKS